MFAEAGELVTVDLIKDRDTGRPKGFAFITFANQTDAAKAITMFNGKEVGGRPLTVNTAKAREDRPSGGRNFGQTVVAAAAAIIDTKTLRSKNPPRQLGGDIFNA